MYTIIESKTFNVKNGVRYMSVVVVSDEEPKTLPKKGTDIGLEDGEMFAPMSTIFVPSTGSIYIADSNGFHPQQ